MQGKRIERNDLGISAREQSSATQKVSMEDLVAVAPVTSIEDALQGQLGGVDIVLGGGDPGARASIQIRGGSTLNANAEPLIVVDGVPYPAEIDDNTDFSTINNDDLGALLNISPQDIESIEVLKDAAATAVWGTSGANGVLVIKTKQGVQGKTRFSFSSKFSAKFEPETIPMLNGNQYSALVSEALWNSANYIGLANSTSYLQMLYGSPEIGYQPDWTYFDEYNQNTDWLSEVRRNTQSWENTFSMSGGGERATYRFSLGYLDEGGTTVGTDFSRLNSSLNVNYKFSDKLNFMHSSLILNLREIITIIMYVGKLSAKHRTNHLTTLTMRQGIVHHSISITMKILHWILLLMVISTIILLLWQMRVSTEPYSGKVK